MFIQWNAVHEMNINTIICPTVSQPKSLKKSILSVIDCTVWTASEKLYYNKNQNNYSNMNIINVWSIIINLEIFYLLYEVNNDIFNLFKEILNNKLARLSSYQSFCQHF